MDKEYFFRPYNEQDLNFISSSWGKSYYDNSDYERVMTEPQFDKYHRPKRTKILNNKDSTILICASKNDPYLIIGWICLTHLSDQKGTILHYLYVKEAFRKLKIAEELLELLSTPVLVTHLTKKGKNILDKNGYFYVPHII